MSGEPRYDYSLVVEEQGRAISSFQRLLQSRFDFRFGPANRVQVGYDDFDIVLSIAVQFLEILRQNELPIYPHHLVSVIRYPISDRLMVALAISDNGRANQDLL